MSAARKAGVALALLIATVDVVIAATWPGNAFPFVVLAVVATICAGAIAEGTAS